MPQKLKVTGPATDEELAAARQCRLNRHDQERLIAVQMAQQSEWKIAQIAKALSRGTATISRWLRKYRDGGICQLLRRANGSRQPQLQPQDLSALKQGLREGKWKAGNEIQKWLAVERGICLSISGVHYWLKKARASCKVPRKKHKDQDPDEVEAFKEGIVDRLHQLEIPPQKRVRIWICDEHRYGLISCVRRCWTLKGHRPEAPVQMKYQWGYVYGAMELTGGEAQFLYLPTVSFYCSYLFLQQLVATDPDALHIVFWDQAGFHPRPDAANLPAQVRLVELGACTAVLNSSENLWDSVKRRVYNAAAAALEAI